MRRWKSCRELSRYPRLGDSLAWDPYASDLWAEESVCWHSWPDQLASLERLTAHDFVRVVPSHGALSPTLPATRMRERLRGLLTRLHSAATTT